MRGANVLQQLLILVIHSITNIIQLDLNCLINLCTLLIDPERTVPLGNSYCLEAHGSHSTGIEYKERIHSRIIILVCLIFTFLCKNIKNLLQIIIMLNLMSLLFYNFILVRILVRIQFNEFIFLFFFAICPNYLV